MKTSNLIGRLFRLGLLTASLSLSCLVQAQWVAFNDHVAGAGTHPNTTRYVVPVITTGASSGPLTNIATGAQLPVTLTITTNGTVNITTGSAAAVPGVGTPAYNVFNGFVEFGAVSTAANAGQAPLTSIVTYTCTGLEIS